MATLRKLTLVELKLFLRDPMSTFFALAFPPLLLVILGSVPAFRKPDADLGGARVIDLYVPIVIGLVLAFLAFSTVPAYLANHRERRVLRRLATTPVGPSRLLLAEMAMSLGLAVLVVALVLGIGDFTPLGAGVQSLQDSLAGAWPRPLDLAVMAVIALVAGLAAARCFRWE